MEQDNNTVNTQVDVPVSVPEQNNMMAEGNEKKKGGNGVLIGLVLCVIAAVAGIGFGVWAMMDGNTQKDNYEKQISSLRNQIGELQNKINSSAEDSAAAEYIYVSDWGVKIKKPDIVKALAYEYNDVNGSLVISLSTQKLEEFNRDMSTGSYTGAESQIILERYSEGTKDKTPYEGDGPAKSKYLFTLDGYDYFGLIGGVVEEINSFFANPENYSRI